MCILEVSLDEELIAETRLSPSQVSLLNLIPGMKVLANITQVGTSLILGWSDSFYCMAREAGMLLLLLNNF